MKKTAFLICLLLNISYLFAQEQMVTTVDATVYTSFFGSSKQKILRFIDENSKLRVKSNETTDELHAEFYLNPKHIPALDTLLTSIGFISTRDVSSKNNTETLRKDKLKIKHLKNEKVAYEELIDGMSEKNERYYNYWEKIRRLEEEIFELESSLIENPNSKDWYVSLRLIDETQQFNDTKVSWVNMPGASYTRIWVENPQADLSASVYDGYALKYLFTKGKSYAKLGILKARDNSIDSTALSELFQFGFGQDWYTKHFGRGKNKFMNLYTGYLVGGIYGTSDTRSSTIGFLEVFMGLELFKNQYFIVDNKIGYFIPFSYNRNLRGLSYDVSFNFVF